ncbi:MAG: FAD-dependent oxidoreductase, partial [Actinomycetota bacterium]
MTAASSSSVDVAIIGGGPAGLSAALALHQLGITNVVLLERESQAGGVPRHSEHLGYGMRDLHRVTTGPRYAAELRKRVEAAGITVRTATTAVDWLDETTLQIADATGLSTVAARCVVLATGVRERPRAARLVAGDRGAGIFTTGSLQQLTANHHQRPGTRAVIVGAEHVSFSAVLTLRHAGCDVVAMVTPLPH